MSEREIIHIPVEFPVAANRFLSTVFIVVVFEAASGRIHDGRAVIRWRPEGLEGAGREGRGRGGGAIAARAGSSLTAA